MKPDQVFSHWKQVRSDLIWTIDQFEDDELSTSPFEGSWPAGKIMIHIASAEEGWFRYVFNQELEGWPQYKRNGYNSVSSIKKTLKDVHEWTERFLDGLEWADFEEPIDLPWSGKQTSLYWIIWHVLEHEIHHRGELSLILGLYGREGLDV